MYIPQHFREDDLSKLHALIQESHFGMIVTQQNGAPVVSHLPFILDAERGEKGTLRGHFARANEQWRTCDGSQEALVVFQGPHAYITPSWYCAPMSVPTWNFAAVHAYGRPRLIEDQDELYRLLADQVRTYEASFAEPWPFDLPRDYTHKLMQNIVGFELPLSRLEGKFKLSQNRPIYDREHVADMLNTSERTEDRQVAVLMRERLKS